MICKPPESNKSHSGTTAPDPVATDGFIGINSIDAVAHSIVVSAFHRMVQHQPYRALGGDYFAPHRRQHAVDRLTRRRERLGYRGRLEPQPVAS
jgi:hypothetical protein